MSFRVKVRCLLAALLLLSAGLVAGQAVTARGQAGAPAPAAAPAGTRWVTCNHCWGKGKVNCCYCDGTGRVHRGSGRYSPCSDCNGYGKKTCLWCDGRGVRRE
jgi:hypothetical protein